MRDAAAAIPARALLGLTAAVLAVHGWLLRGAPQQVQAHHAARPATFATRTVPLLTRPSEPLVLAAPSPGAAAKSPAPPDQPGLHFLARAAASAQPPKPAMRLVDASVAPSRLLVPGSMQMRYEVTGQTRGQPWAARSDLRWQRAGEDYEATLETGNPGQPLRIQHSSGRVTAQGLAPARFSEKARTEQAVHFERDSQRVSFSNNRPAAALLPGAQDRLSVLLQLSAMLAGDPARYPPRTRISIQTASIREAETWVFTVGDEEQLELPGGTVGALKLERPPRHEYDHRVELWLSPGQDYAPVRLRLTQPNGDWVDQQWASTDTR